MIVEDEEIPNETGGGDITENGICTRRRVLVSTEAAELLNNAGEGSLGKFVINTLCN